MPGNGPTPQVAGFERHRFSVFYVLCWVIILLVAAVRISSPRDFWKRIAEVQESLQISDLHIGSIFRMMSVEPIFGLIFVYALAPTLAALLLLKATRDAEGLRDWLSRLHPLRGTGLREGLRWYGAIFAGYLVLVVLFGALSVLLGDEAERSPLTAGLTEPTLALSTIKAIFVDEGALLEEMGWRAYGYPLLLSHMSPLRASALLGSLWGLWHIPSQLGSPYYSLDADFVAFQLVFVVYSIALTVLTVFFVNKLGGSVWAAILVHGFGNYTGVAAPGTVLGVHAGFFWKTVLMVILCAALIAVTRGRLGLPSPEPRTGDA